MAGRGLRNAAPASGLEATVQHSRRFLRCPALRLCQANMETQKGPSTDYCPFKGLLVRFHVSLGSVLGTRIMRDLLALQSKSQVPDLLQICRRSSCSLGSDECKRSCQNTTIQVPISDSMPGPSMLNTLSFVGSAFRLCGLYPRQGRTSMV